MPEWDQRVGLERMTGKVRLSQEGRWAEGKVNQEAVQKGGKSVRNAREIGHCMAVVEETYRFSASFAAKQQIRDHFF